jgi:deoxyribodipyrimidine photo-lyase
VRLNKRVACVLFIKVRHIIMTSCIIWFRQDLRLHDNPAITNALQDYDTVYPIFILDQDNAQDWAAGGARQVWLHHSLKDLNTSLLDKLTLFKGKADDIIASLCEEQTIDAVFWNRCYEPWRMERDRQIKDDLKTKNIECQSFNSQLLWEPWQINKNDGTPYKVFTPFYRKGCLGFGEPDEAGNKPHDLTALAKLNAQYIKSIDDLDLLPAKQQGDWDEDIANHWDISEKGAYERLDQFLEDGLDGYKIKRDRPDLHHYSMLSPYLHHGQISPRHTWHRVRQLQAANDVPEKDADHFLSELGWREFSYNLLYNNHNLPETPLQKKFEHFPWANMRLAENKHALECWQKGQTGYPFVDAAMRQLYETGWMHNRLRMLVGSFLIKDLLIHWRHGEEWFWDCLVDADLASNSASWQWIAGCGADAAPYFRVFNPITQSAKFDPNAEFIRKWVPEIQHLSDKFIHAPWTASPDILAGANIKLGETYPHPIVDHAEARNVALAAFQELKQYTN